MLEYQQDWIKIVDFFLLACFRFSSKLGETICTLGQAPLLGLFHEEGVIIGK